ncbi:MAG: 5-deoxy-glucuronate isomerase, partial [Nitrospiraceae bacterium]
MQHHLKSDPNAITRLEVTPHSAGWKYLGFQVLALEAGTTHAEKTNGNEIAVVPLDGRGSLSAAGETYEVAREGVFSGLPSVL